MDTVIRAARGALRSSTRTLIVVLVLAVGLSFALTSVALALAAGDELDKIKQTTGVEAALTVNPEQFQDAINAALEEAGGWSPVRRVGRRQERRRDRPEHSDDGRAEDRRFDHPRGRRPAGRRLIQSATD